MNWLSVLRGGSALAIALVCSAAHAQTNETPSMTLEQALAYAADHHPRLLVDVADVKARKAAAEVPGKRWLPQVGVTAQAIGGTNNNSGSLWLSSRGAVEMPRIAGTAFLQRPSQIDWKPYVNTAIAAGFEQELFDFGRIAAERSVADARASSAKAGERADRLDVVLGVREAFFAVQAAHQVLAAADQVVQRATVHRDAICALGREGLRPQADCARGQADLARYQAARSRSEGSLDSACVTFAAAMGHERDRVDVRGDAPQVDASVPSFSEAVAGAEAHEPRMQVAEAEAHASKSEVERSSAALRPQIYGIGTVMGSAGGAPVTQGAHGAYGDGVVPFVPNYYAGVVMSWQMIDAPGRAEHATREAEAATSQERIHEVREQTKTAAAQAWVAAESTMRTVPELQNALSAAEISYAQVDGRYKEGLATVIELTDVESLRVDAEINLAIGQFEAARARAQLDRALAKENRP